MTVTPPDRVTTVRLHRLTMVPEDDGVMVGRPDTASYALFPEEGAEALRMLDRGTPLGEVADWYERTCGETLDVDDFLEVLGDLGFVTEDGEPPPPAAPVRWQRLGRWTFSRPAWLVYTVLLVAAAVEWVRDASLRPSYHDVFFTSHLALIPITLTVVQIPCILVHEGYHALSGRRLGLPSTLTISRRLYYLVAETRLDSLFSVERRRRYLPFLAGMLADAVLIAGLDLLVVALRGHGVPHWVPALLLAVAFTCVMRLLWQFMFYLETDLYYVVTNALRCSDLQNATRAYVRRRFRDVTRGLPRPGLRRGPAAKAGGPLASTDTAVTAVPANAVPATAVAAARDEDRAAAGTGTGADGPDAEGDGFEEQWSERDRAMARWYAPLLVVGYGFSLGSLAWAGIPTTVHFWSLVSDRFRGSGTPTGGLLDAVSFVGLTGLQIGLLLYVTVRDRRAARATSTEGAPS
ncbi:hypothetical protein [Actinacidiphila rubida]|uniref:PqqD family protein n=1 Tax=Actinacidiphila rubida TaxID=310780 RepID=A0A1H8GLG7_9ACTN|nr:hypothetical protein [Actinacidiphila rubida]SEN44337.1 hypothetical protein SAMN05216267_1005141 [Actinacidiphila rubida]